MKRNPPQASPEITSAPRAAQAETPDVVSGNETLIRQSDGAHFLRTIEKQYFDGKKWRAWTSATELEGAGIPYSGDHPRKRERYAEKALTPEQARKWILNNLIPLDYQASFAPPLAGPYGTMPEVEKNARAVGLTPDALVSYAVSICLEYLSEFPEGLRYFEGASIDMIETRKWKPSMGAVSLFNSLYKDALGAPFEEGISRLKALRDLIGANPAFAYECETISRMVGAAWSLSMDTEGLLASAAA
jgi:hypothetical protein